ncbi:MAG: ATP-binding protein, partial [Saprospiraceae bacterium]
WTVFDERNGLPNNKVAGLVADERGHFWVSTYFGLCCLDPKSGRAINFFQEDGLSHNEFNRHSFLRDAAGRCWFGSINGVTGFDPEAILRSAPSPVKSPLLLSNVSWYAPDGKTRLSVDTALSSLNRLTIYPANRYCVFRFSLANFQNPLANQYAYRLDGLDDDWIYLGANPEIVLNHLSAGTYTLRVKAAGPDGEWAVYERPIRLAVLAPWYARWWAVSLWALALGGMLVAFYRYQLRKKMEQAENKRLRELNEFKSRFFTNITHEFRTPLTVILGMTERMLSGESGAGASEAVTSSHRLTQPVTLIKRNADNLLRLINQILDLAKMESNALKANYVQGDVLPYLRYICESLHSMANAQNVLLRVESSEAELVMDYDPERLLQIVHNLLSNAIKFTPSGGRVQLAVAVGSGSRQWTVAALPTANCLLLTVSDTGAGIPPEDLPNIFDRFYQADNLEKAKAGGTGIGLALTKELVQLMGGQIGVESTVGKGTRFTVTLPITKNAPLVSPTPDPSPEWEGRHGLYRDVVVGVSSPLPFEGGVDVSGDSSFPIHHSSLPSLLLIEDNPDVVEYLAVCLADIYRLDFAYNGRAGIEKALETVPDLIISDVMMPEKDGFEVCDTLKNDERTSHIPIVLLTAKADMESRIAGLRRGADAYLAKPFHKEELEVTIANLLESRKKWQARFGNAESGMRNAELRSAEPDHSAFRIPDSAFDLEDAFVQKVRSAVEARLSDASFSVDHLCRAMAMSQPQLHRKLTALTGKNATLFIRSVRLAKAKELLSKKEKTVSEVAYEVGFDDPKYFSRVFAEEYGVAPSKA